MMFGLGFIELAAIALVALVLIRPKDLPGVFRKLGSLYRRARGQLAAAKRVLRDLEADLEDPGSAASAADDPGDTGDRR